MALHQPLVVSHRRVYHRIALYVLGSSTRPFDGPRVIRRPVSWSPGKRAVLARPR